MQNVVAINAAARQGIIAAQATSDEALLESIAEGGRTAMHMLYSRHHVRVYRFILRMVRDTTTAEDLTSQVFLDVWRTASQFQGRSQVSTWLLSIARFKALTALASAPARGHRSGGNAGDCRRAPRRRKPASTAPAPARSCAPASPNCRRRIARSSTSSTTMRSRSRKSGNIIGIPQSTVKTRMFYARKQLADLLKVAGVESLGRLS